MSLEVGQILGGKYLIERVIGRGSMGLVYEGRDTAADQRVAIRLILPEFDNERVPAFTENDATVVGQLGNEHIAQLFNMGFLPSGERCIVSEYVDGEVLQRRMKRLGCMSELTVAQLLIQLLESLSVAHEAGVVHRDLTPLSIFIVPRRSRTGDAVKLINFGISRLQLLTANPEAPPASIVAETESFQYLSPEQLNGLRELDPRSNIYTLGVIAYEAITGKLPFEGKDFGDLTFNILQEDPTPVEALAPESSSPFAQLIGKAMARSPNARFQYAEEMYAAISNWAIRAGISQSVLLSGISDWRNHDLEEPISSEPASTAEPSPDDGTMPEEQESANPVEPSAVSQVTTRALDEPENELTDQSVAMPAETETLPLAPVGSMNASPIEDAARAVETDPRAASALQQSPVDVGDNRAGAVADPYQQPARVGLAEEDALFAPPPAPPRDELPFVPLDDLATNLAAPAPMANAPEQLSTHQPPEAISQSAAHTEYSPQNYAPLPSNAEIVPQASAPAAIHVPPAPTPPVVEVPFRQSRTILGIGGVVVRGPQSTEPGIHPSPAAKDTESTAFRPKQSTEPGINPNLTAKGSLAALAAAASSSSRAQTPARSVEPVAPAEAVAAVQSPGAATQPTPPPTIVAAADDLEELGPYGAAPSRSRKSLTIAIVLVGLVLAGGAFALLQNKNNAGKSASPEPTRNSAAPMPSLAAASALPAASVQTVPVASTVETKLDSGAKESTAASRKTAAPTLSQSIASTESGARPVVTAQPKPQRPTRPVQGSQSSGVSVPTKQGYSKPATGYDPYRYR